MTPTSVPLFLHEDGTFTATELARGPWDPRHCHGGPVSALLARAAEQADTGGMAWHLARLTVELTRPVPVLAPLRLEVAVERPGRKVSLVAAVLRAGELEVARLRALRIRDADVDIPNGANLADDPPMDPPDGVEPAGAEWASADHVAFHSHACEHRFVRGTWDGHGPVDVWIRLLHPVVAGEVPSGAQRAAAAADFGNGVSAALPYERFVYINPDLTIHLARPVEGDWVGMRSASYYSAAGSGLAESALFDRQGRVGRSCQSLFVDPR